MDRLVSRLLAGQVEARGPRFADLADLVVDVRPPEAIADLVVARLHLARPG